MIGRGLAADRRCMAEPEREVRGVFAEEAEHLLLQPEDPAPLLERVAVKLGKTPTFASTSTTISCPYPYTAGADGARRHPRVRIVDGVQVLACHRRSSRSMPSTHRALKLPARSIKGRLVCWKR